MNKNVFLWALYDFGNTFLFSAIGGLYLAQWVVIDNKFADIWYGGTFSLATILLLLTSPFWGAWSDKLGKRMPFLTWSTIIFFLFGLFLALTAASPLPIFSKVMTALIIFLIMQYAYQVSLIFYDALLTKISTPKTLGKISGIGDAFGEVGWLLGPAALLPFAMGMITLLGEPGRSQAFLPAVLLSLIFTLPMLLWFREPKTKIATAKLNFKSVYNQTINGLKFLITHDRNALILLTAFMLIADALFTSALFFAIFLEQIYKAADTQKFLALALMEIVAIPSAYLIGKLADRYGIKRLMIISSLDLALGLFLAGLSFSLGQIYVFSAFLGIGFGGLFTTARVLLTKISPPERLGEYFGFYATFQRFASIIGPLTWGGVTLFLASYGVVRYRIAVLALVFLMLIGTVLLTRVKEARQVQISH